MSPCTSNKVVGSGVLRSVARVMGGNGGDRRLFPRTYFRTWPNSDVAGQKNDDGTRQRARPQMTARYRESAANSSTPRYRIMIVQGDFLLRMETAADLRQWGYDV